VNWDAEHGLRIVYLDDSDALLAEASRVLTAAGHKVQTALRLSEAVGLLGRSDLVIIDFHMPGVDGSEALLRLRKQVDPSTIVLFYLYTSDRQVALSYKQYGFDGAFTAKGDSDVLVSQVEAAGRMLKLKRFRQQREA